MKKKPETNKPMDNSPSFEESLETLQQIVHDLEQGELSLTDSLQKYEEGIRSLKFCHQQLEWAEQRIEILTGIDAEGNAITEPLEESSMTLEEKADARGQRRSRPSKRPKKKARKSERPDEDDTGPSLF